MLPITAKAAEGDAESEVTIGFSEKTIKEKKKDPDPKKIVDPIKKGDGDNNGKIFYKVLPQTGEVSNNILTYVGLALVLGSALSYKTFKKRGEQ